ncbi:carbon-nitrogen hydrolase family protein [Desulfofundulus thermosubterraneus]|uniref:Predicted amidohydrolase n=1 Tax=Desulfofundulus thermosubterraneus DSM 16057 TaxID=1121432 RepID=A0A1M6CIB7_9FIRM|nr:carbon-nitrogen hydrolase family protein [Desulfofundulus thermosubterraneus]SHI60494.1 Predicted amidohydrolase [Desulfofundulus thermosubterraneus DSM 16057]
MSANPITVAAVQMKCFPGNKEKNLQKALTLIDDARSKGAELIVLPELFLTGYRVEEEDLALAETIPGYAVEQLGKYAREKKVFLAGTIMEVGVKRGVVYNTAFLIGPDGLIGTYRKVHLWDREQLRWACGEEYPVFPTPFGRVGIQICYEVGFPESARILTLKGADMLLYPSAFGLPRLYAWDLATRSRALENGVFLIAANRSGQEKDTQFAGHSRIVNPQGKVLAEAKNDDEAIVATVDLAEIAEQRRRIPYLKDLKRFLVLKKLSKAGFADMLNLKSMEV